MACNNCYEDFLCKCTPYNSAVVINTSIEDGDYIVRLTDSNGNMFDADAVKVEAGLEFNVAAFPEGFFSGQGNQFNLEVFRTDITGKCASVKIPMVSYVDCITISVKGGSIDKSEIGCVLSCMPSAAQQSALVTFEDQETVTIPWAGYLATYGNNPLIQVYHLVSPDVYQLASISIQTNYINGVLDNIVIDNGGSASGYVVIS
jgi:hypothetical protein